MVRTVKLKPGKYVQRDGGIATVAAVDEGRPSDLVAIGWSSGGSVCSWYLDGRSAYGHGRSESYLDLIREYREPREWWIAGDWKAFKTREEAKRSLALEIIHVREVIE